jgi:3',5'-cyclic AMP phosphodiesterase CpdA
VGAQGKAVNVRRLLFAAVFVLAAAAVEGRQGATLPAVADSVKFAVIGDNGTGDAPQYAVGQQMAAARAAFPFSFVLMLGDNMYGRQTAQDFVDKFERPYMPLLHAGVLFYASLGNHDDQSNRFYKPFNMNGERYYTFAKKNVRFVALDSNLLDARQLAWTESVLKARDEAWTICYFHHPLYSNAGRHGSNVALRVALEPLLVRYGVDVVFSGHDHVYERLKPQKGITYFVEGSAGELRKGDVKPADSTAAFFDMDQTFMLVEIAGDELRFEARSRTGRVVDSGTVRRALENGKRGAL